MRWLGALTFVALAGCQGAALRGGRPLPPGGALPGARVSVLQPTVCRDARGAAAWRPPLRLVLVRSGERLVLVEERPGYASLVFERGRRDAADWLYQIVVESEDDEVLREYRLTHELARATLHVYSEYRIHREDFGAIEATGARRVLTCSLEAAAPGSV